MKGFLSSEVLITSSRKTDSTNNKDKSPADLIQPGTIQPGDSQLDKTLGETMRSQGISRRSFLKFCAATASMMAMSPAMIPKIAHALENARRPSVIWLSFQECTGCTESLTRAHTPTVESLIFDTISLDYHHTLQAAAGHAAEAAREAAMEENSGSTFWLNFFLHHQPE